MNDILNQFRRMAGAVKKQMAGLGGALKDIRSRIAALEAEQLALQRSPITKNDWCNVLLADIDNRARAADLPSIITEKIVARSGLGRPLINAHVAGQVLNGGEELPGYTLLSPFVYRGEGDGPFSHMTVWFLLREPLKAAVRQAFEEITDWPYPDARPLAETLVRLSDVEAELAILRDEEARITGELRETAVTLARGAHGEAQ